MMSSLDQSSFINQTSVEASYEPSISVKQRIEAERSEVPDKVRTIPREPEKNNSTISHGVIGNNPCWTVYALLLLWSLLLIMANAIVESITERRNFELTSLSQLREAVKNNTDQVLRDTFKDSIFVGCVSEKHCLIQHGTRLYIFCLERVAEEFFYQRFLEEFGNCGVICLSV